VAKKYSAEFKADAVRMYLDHPGATYKEIAADLGLNAETLRGWVQAARKTPLTGESGPAGGTGRAPLGSPTVRDEEIRQLKAQLRKVTEERDILRKAAAVFSGGTPVSSPTLQVDRPRIDRHAGIKSHRSSHCVASQIAPLVSLR
jgi:transposase